MSLWDAVHPLMTGVVLLLTGTAVQLRLIARGGDAFFTPARELLIGVLYVAGLIAVFVVNFLWLRVWVNRARRPGE